MHPPSEQVEISSINRHSDIGTESNVAPEHHSLLAAPVPRGLLQSGDGEEVLGGLLYTQYLSQDS